MTDITFLEPPKINEDLLDVIEQTKREIEQVFHVDSKHLGSPNNRTAKLTKAISHRKTPKIG